MAAAAAMAAMATDPMAMAAYMSSNPTQYPADPQHYEQFNFGFTPAFGFGYAGTGSLDYMSIQPAQQGSNLNPQSTQWTPSGSAATARDGKFWLGLCLSHMFFLATSHTKYIKREKCFRHIEIMIFATIFLNCVFNTRNEKKSYFTL